MRVVLVLLLALAACQYKGAESVYGRSNHDVQFGEVDFVLQDADGGALQGVPFVVAGQGTLPAEYGDGSESFSRISVGQKARYPIVLREGKIYVYLEGGAMVSYYEADAIHTPIEFESVVGIGTQIQFGEGWWVNLAFRARKPMGNGHRHDEPDHAPDGVQSEVVLGVRKDF